MKLFVNAINDDNGMLSYTDAHSQAHSVLLSNASEILTDH